MTDLPSVEQLYAVTEATWPPVSCVGVGPVQVRYGAGGGKRVSAATCDGALGDAARTLAEEAMQGLGQTPLFQLRVGEEDLDQQLADAGYKVIDPVNLYVCPVDLLTSTRPPPVTAFQIWEPLAIMYQIWGKGGIGPGRWDVMARAQGPKTGLFGRHKGRAAATGFVAIHDGIAMVHALEVLPDHRQAGMGCYLMQEAAFWATEQGADHIAVICTQANVGANALYSSIGMTLVGHYHYRIKEAEV